MGKRALRNGVGGWAGAALAAAALFASSASSGPAAAQGTPAMVLPGQPTVGSTGAFSYTIPIAVPPGTGGMVPSLSLSYSSQNGNGLEGQGWTLSGLPSIGRCPRTIATDGIHGSVNYDDNDRFCMDGQRLVVINNGTYGADGAEYRTEIDGFTKIISHGAAGNGPAWFEVHTKSGQVMEFGDFDAADPSNSRILAVGKTEARVWAVNRIEDTVGNYLTVTYNSNQSAGESYPVRIDYTGNAAAGLATYNSVRFTYASRPDVIESYLSGSVVKTAVRLTNIKTSNANTVIADYRLAYDLGTTTSRTLLTSVTQCDGGTKCLPATTFEWEGSRGHPTLSSTGISLAQGTAVNRPTIFPADFNNDGLTDVVVSSADTNQCKVFLGVANSSIPQASTYEFKYTYYEDLEPPGPWQPFEYQGPCLENLGPSRIQLPDFNGDGYADMASDIGHGASTGEPRTQLMFNDRAGHIYQQASFRQKSIFGDFNGDGRTDILARESIAGDYFPYYSNGDGTFTKGPVSEKIVQSSTLTLSVADFDGNGCADVLQQDGATRHEVRLYCKTNDTVMGAPDWTGFQVVFGDFNGDGAADTFAVSQTAKELRISTGLALPESTPTGVPADPWKYLITAGDFNGDGRTDLAYVASGATGGFGPGESHKIYLSTGTDFVLETSIPNPISNNDTKVNAVVADWNNDGASDIWLQQPSGDKLQLFAFAPDAIDEAKNGIGVTTSPVYERLNKGGTLYSRTTDATYPTRDLDGPLYVVSQLDSSNGIGGTYSSTYTYAGAKANLQGRGFLGFKTTTVKDSQTLVVQTTDFLQQFPFTGMVTSQTKVRGTGPGQVVLNTTTNVYGSRLLNGAKTTFVFPTSMSVAANDLNGAQMPSVATAYEDVGAVKAFDDYGNPRRIRVTTTSGAEKLTFNTYDNDTADWHLGRLRTSTVTSTVGTSTITRKSAFEYNGATGLLNKEVVEPDDAAFTLTTTYIRDAFGNKTRAIVSGADIVTRATNTEYDVQGRYVDKVINALGQSEDWVQNPAFGLPTSQTGPNGLTTTRAYDEFGRKTLEDRPDGTSTTVEYKYCSGVAGGTETCPTRGAFLVRTKTFGTDGTTKIGPTSTVYFDALSRQIAARTEGFDGAAITVDTVYDANGRVEKSSRPYFVIGGTARWTVFTYDALGRVTKSTAPDNSETSYGFNGLTTTVTNALNQTTTTKKNNQGLNDEVTNALGKVTEYTYDAFDNLTRIVDPAGNTTRHYYDVRGRKTQSNDPDMGVWNYTYDVLGQLKTQTDAKSQITTLAYDKLGRLTSRVEPGLTSTWTYDTAPDGVGKLHKAETGAGYVRTHAYDTLSRPKKVTIATGGQTYDYQAAYSTVSGKLQVLTYPSNLALQYNYNATGYLSSIKDNGSGASYWTANTRDAELHLLQQTAGNGMVTNQAFVAATGLIDTIKTTASGGASNGVANFSYDFDALGNLTARADANTSLAETFTYDELNRLKRFIVTGGADRTVTYDDLGNIATKQGVGTYTYGGTAGPHAVTSITGTVYGVVNPTFTYDNNGNMTSGAGRTLTWTSFNLAATVSQGTANAAFTYDPEHKRVTQTGTVVGGEVRYLNDPMSGAMAERFIPTSGNSLWRDYIMAEGRVIALRTYNSTSGNVNLRYFVGDHLGSTAVIVANNGTVIERLSYDAWGLPRNPDGTYPTTPIVSAYTTKGFTGQEMMSLLGLVNLNARLYDPLLGRFLTADPVTEQVYDLQILNRYSYVGNNPLSFTDPSGLCFLGCFWQQSWFRPVVAITAAFAFQYYLLPAVWGMDIGFYAIANISTLSAGKLIISAAISGGIGGFINTGTLKGALIGAGQAAAFFAVGSALQVADLSGFAAHAAEFVSHGVVGGLTSIASGGEFGSGFLAAGFSSQLTPAPSSASSWGDVVQGTIIAAVVGGAASELGGGKFKNGAITGAFGYLFNRAAHKWGAAGAVAGGVTGGIVVSGACDVATVGLCIPANPATFAGGALVGAGIGYVAGTVAGTVVDELVVVASRPHANSSSSMNGTELYYLINRNSGEIDKIGVTSTPATRYSQAYLEAENVNYFTKFHFQWRYVAYLAENLELMGYLVTHGNLPRLNKTTR